MKKENFKAEIIFNIILVPTPFTKGGGGGGEGSAAPSAISKTVTSINLKISTVLETSFNVL